ncbi:MAG TPA: hypothetical protein VGL61_02525 [Kofleriaceae bacterium]|jgi:hypothetical protein
MNRTRIEDIRRGLGWFSVGLGAAELVTPRLVAKIIGAVPNARTSFMLRLAGLREIGAGMSLLLTKHPLPVWLRVVGDALDLGMLGVASTARRANGVRLVTAAAAVSAIAALDAFTALRTTTALHEAR